MHGYRNTCKPVKNYLVEEKLPVSWNPMYGYLVLMNSSHD